MLSLEDYITIQDSYQRGRQSSFRNLGKRTKAEEEEYAKDSAFNFVFKYQSVTFDPSIHSASQARDRRPEFSKEDWKKLHRKVFWYMKDNKVKGGVFLFYNQEMEQGYVAAVKSGGRIVKIVTVLPRGADNPLMGSKGTTEYALVEFRQALTEAGAFYIFESFDDIPVIQV